MGGAEKTRSKSDTVVPGVPSGDLHPGVVSYPVLHTWVRAGVRQVRADVGTCSQTCSAKICACLRRNVEIAQKHSTGNSFLPICPGGNLDGAGFQGREEGAGWMLWLLRGAQSHRWTWPGAYADRTLYVSLHFSARSPARVHRRPERNINHPNSICGSRSYFLDEQCRHFCVMDDEHAGIACC